MSANSVALCLIPEFPYNLYGEYGVLEYCYKRLQNRKRMVAVVAEGVGIFYKLNFFSFQRLLINI